MLWRSLRVGPLLGGQVRVGFDRAPVALRWFEAAPAELPATPWPPEPHPNLARLLRVERSGGGAVAVSELALGPTLEMLGPSAQNPAVVAGLCSQLLAGLEALHRAGRAHGRLHPGNLVLDVQRGVLRVQDLCAAAFEGVPRAGDPRTLFTRPGQAAAGPTPEGDVYSVGRIAEALLRGGPPRLHFAPLGGVEGPGLARLCEWIARCQSLDPAVAFAGAEAAREALRGLGAEGEQTFAHVRAGRWLLARRRAERALAAWGTKGGREIEGPAAFTDVIASQRAAHAWRQLGMAAGGALLLSGGLALRTPGASPAVAVSATASAQIQRLREALLAASKGPRDRAGDPLQAALLDPAAPAVLAVLSAADAGPTGLPEDLGEPLRDLGTAFGQFGKEAKPCQARLEGDAAAALAAVQPGAAPSMRHAVALLATERLAARPDEADAESETRGALAIADSPMLDRAVDRVAGDGQLARCVQTLGEDAAKVDEALGRCREALDVGSEPGSDRLTSPSGGSVR
ncbi:MAG: protein kinase family protein [Myxococcales bacterium]